MKKILPLVLAAVLLFALTGCGGDPAQSTPTPEPKPAESAAPAAKPTPAPTPTPEPTPEPEPEPALTPVNIGDTVSLDFVEFTLTDFGQGEKITEGSSSLSWGLTQGCVGYWLHGTMVNNSAETFKLWNACVRIIFDDKYTYEGSVMNIGPSELAPLVEASVYLCADVPPRAFENCQKVTVQLGFNENFAEFDWDKGDRVPENFDYAYEFVQGGAEGGTEQPAAEPAAESDDPKAPTENGAPGKDDGSVKAIAIGDTITTDEYEFTLNNVEFTYDLKPSNTSGFYTSYPADSGKVYVHVDGTYYNTSKKDLHIRDLCQPTVDYDDGYTYSGFAIVDDGDDSFTWASSYIVCTPLDTCHYHGLVECPEVVESSDAPLFVTLTLADGVTYRYDIR